MVTHSTLSLLSRMLRGHQPIEVQGELPELLQVQRREVNHPVGQHGAEGKGLQNLPKRQRLERTERSGLASPASLTTRWVRPSVAGVLEVRLVRRDLNGVA